MKKKRIGAYIDEAEHRRLRLWLIRQGKTISQWLREQIKRYLEDS